MTEIKALNQNNQKRLGKQIMILIVIAILMIAFFLFYRLELSLSIILMLRVKRLLALLIVAVNLSIATVLFQGVTHNPILTPGIMGYEAIFTLITTIIIAFTNVIDLSNFSNVHLFLLQLMVMVIVSVNVFSAVLKMTRHNIHLLLLIGIILGTFLRSIVSMLTSIMDPQQFMIVQDTHTASFSVINTESLGITVILSVICWVIIFTQRFDLAMMALGRDTALNLGVDYERMVRFTLMMIALLVSSSTALVGPLMFFGLLSTQITVHYLNTASFKHVLFTSAFVGIIILIGGQSILEHLLKQATILPVVIEIVGGSLLLWMIKKGSY